MRRIRETTAVIMGLFGVALVVRGAWGGLWPLSVQLLFGLGLVAYAAVSWRLLHR